MLKTSNLRGALAIMLMMSMMSVISSLYLLKVFLLFVLVILCIKDTKVCKTNRHLCIFLCLSTLWGIFWGAVSGHEHAFECITIGVLWPILSLIIVTPLLKDSDDYRVMIKWMFYMHAFLIVYDLLYASNVLFGTPIINLYPEEETGFSFYETTSRINLINLNTLTFTTPLFFLLYLTHYKFGVNSLVQFVVLLLNLFLLIFSGRRSLMLIFFVCPVFTILFSRFFPKESAKRTKRYLALLLVIIIGALGYVYTTMPEVFDGYLHTFTKAFDKDEESVRFDQSKMLWGHFVDNPIIGDGDGAVYYKSNKGIYSHQFELTYLHKLATRGVVGFTLYFLGTVGVLLVGIKYARKRRDELFICMLFAFFFVLIADATNPVLCSFDLMLPLFLCYAKINSDVYNYDHLKPNEI